jgi:GTP-binding protein EngB required for normal cell division
MQENVKNIITATRDEIVRLMLLQKKNLSELTESPDLFGKDKGTLDRATAKEFCDQLENEIGKAKRLELVVAVVGTMKAGKSTAINAIVGAEVLPNRSEAMTTLPTVIRHCVGKVEPLLRFDKRKPFNDLIVNLKARLANLQKSGQLDEMLKSGHLGANEKKSVPHDIRALIQDLMSGALVELNSEYEGRSSIYGFLRCLNDLVRLARLVDIEPPLDAYSQMIDFPLIEVEFAHLKGMEGHGSFALLDTPGPNEAMAGSALRKVLQEQLPQASAVLAVIDYTQRGTDADQELRDFLGNVLEQLQDRLYVVVNKFDQCGPNDHNYEQTRQQIASQAFGGKVSVSNVFPVASLLAYYANAALRELTAHRQLPLAEPWVEKFGQLALGMVWRNQIENSDAVRNAAIGLWSLSHYDPLTTTVIKGGYRHAAFLAMKSALSLTSSQSGKIDNFLVMRTQATGKDVAALQALVDGLQQDVDTVAQAKTQLHSQAKQAQSKLSSDVSAIQEKTRKGVDGKLSEFFKTGQVKTKEVNKKRVEDAKASEEDKKQSWVNNFIPRDKVKEPEGNLFNPDEPRIPFQTEEMARDFNSIVWGEITTITAKVETTVQGTLNRALKELAKQMHEEVNEQCLKPIVAKAQQRFEGDGFSLRLDLPEAQFTDVDGLDMKSLANETIKQHIKREKKTRKVEQSGAWGWLKRKADFFDNEWGCDRESYTVEHKHFVVDLADINTRVSAKLEAVFNDLFGSIEVHIKQSVIPEIDKALHQLSVDLEGYRGDLLGSIQEKSKSREEQEHIQKRLNKVRQSQNKLQPDIATTRSEISAIEQNAYQA